MFGERRSSGQARLGCRSCSRRPIRSPRELRRRVRKSKEESIGNGARDTRLLDTRLLSAPADKLQRSNKFRARRHWSAIVSCFILWRKNRHSAFLRCAGRCRELGRVLTASRAPGSRPPADGAKGVSRSSAGAGRLALIVLHLISRAQQRRAR